MRDKIRAAVVVRTERASKHQYGTNVTTVGSRYAEARLLVWNGSKERPTPFSLLAFPCIDKK